MTRPMRSLGRVLDDLGDTLLEPRPRRRRAVHDIGGVVIHDPLDEPRAAAETRLVLGVGVDDADQIGRSLERSPGSGAAALVVRAPVELTAEVRAAADRSGVARARPGARGVVGTARRAAALAARRGRRRRAEPSRSAGCRPATCSRSPTRSPSLLDAPVTIEDRQLAGARLLRPPGRGRPLAGRDDPRAARCPSATPAILDERGVFRELLPQRPAGRSSTRIPTAEGVTMPRVAIAVRAGDEVLGSIWAAVPDGALTEERDRRAARRRQAGRPAPAPASAPAPTCSAGSAPTCVGTALEGGAGAREALARLGLAGAARCCVLGAALVATRGARRSARADRRPSERQRFADAFAMHLERRPPGSRRRPGGRGRLRLCRRSPARRGRRGAAAARSPHDFLDRVGDRHARRSSASARSPPTSPGSPRSRAARDRVLRVLRDGHGDPPGRPR